MTEEERELQTRAALTSVEARAFVWWILEEAGIFRTTFVPGAPDQSAWNEGRRSLGLQVLERIERDAPGSTDQMKREASNHVSNSYPGSDAGHAAPERGAERPARDAAPASARRRSKSNRALADYEPAEYAGDADEPAAIPTGDT